MTLSTEVANVGAADRHEPVMKPIKTFELVAAVQRNIGNPTS